MKEILAFGAVAFGFALLACAPLHDLDAASRGSAGKGGASVGAGGSTGGNVGVSLEILCKDGTLNGAETDVDCGGGSCDTCSRGFLCTHDSDCALNSCVNRRCQSTHCTDNQLSSGETDVDCGGDDCPRCGVHQACKTAQDCTSNLCVDGSCLPSSCDDGTVDGYETDLNCGGITCAPCRLGRRCNVGGDCQTGICLEQACSTAACGNGVRDAEEEGVDCGGACPKACEPTCSGVEVTGCASGGTTGVGGGGALARGGGGSGGAGAGGGMLGSGGEVAWGGRTAAGGAPASGGTTAGGSGGTLASGGALATGGATTFADPTCSGCARLFVPLGTATDKANFVITLPAVKDFSVATITLRVYLQAGSGGFVKGYIQHSGSPDFLQLFQNTAADIASLGGGWRDIVWNVAAQSANYDKTIIGRVGVQVTSLGATKWSNPTVVYVDSITVSGVNGGVGPWTFDQSSSVAAGGFGAPVNALFTNFGDSPVTNSAATWYSK